MRARGLAIVLACACSHDGSGDGGTTGSSSTGAMTTTTSSSSSGAETSSSGATTVVDTGSSSGGESSTGEVLPGHVMVYVASGTQIHAWRVEPNGGTLVDHDALDLGVDVGPLAHAGDRLWVGRWGDDSIGTLAIDPTTGALDERGSVEVGGMIVYLSVDRAVAHVLASDFNGNEVSSWPLDGDGIAKGPATATVGVGTNPHSIVLAPAGDFAFVPHLTSQEVRQFVYDDADGSLVPNDPDRVMGPAGAGPRHMIFADDARFAWVINESGDSITRWVYDAGAGLLSEPVTVSTLPEGVDGSNNYCADLHLGPGGAFLYASNRGEDTLAMFAVDPGDGTLLLFGQVPTEAHPRSFAVEPGMRWLYAAGRDSGRLASYAIGGDGSLAPIEIVDAPPQPGWVEAVALPR